MTILDAEVVTRCPFCGEAHTVLVNEMDYYDWQDGKLAQDAFPYLSTDEREMLISGICTSCWCSMWGSADDDYEDEDPDDDEDCDWGYNEDMGFDPYLGCYTDDC